MFTKVIKYNSKVGVDNAKLEIEIQNNASLYGFAPEIYETIFEPDSCTIVMEHMNEVCLQDKYGKNKEDIPEYIWEQIHDIICTLYEDEGVEYIDIKADNFIEKEGDVYIIDFGHAYYKREDREIDWFLRDFLDGVNEWNPDFAQ